jgi:hypothetical protein
MFKQLSLASLAITALILAEGCQSTATHEPAANTAGKTVMCDQCNASWQQKTVVNDKGVAVPTVTSSSAQVCPTCQKAAEGYYTSGHLATRCQSCGGKMHVME